MRTCAVCGKPVLQGMTDEDGTFYCHEECFPEYMDSTYGMYHWMNLGDGAEDEFGGYYIVSDDTVPAGFSGTGIYWTTWEEDADE